MAKPKEVDNVKQQYVVGKVNENLWRRFRAILVMRGLSVPEGLELALAEWVEANS